MLIVTTNEIPGYRITRVHGDVFGVTARSSNLYDPGHRAEDGEFVVFTNWLVDCRNQARERLRNAARAEGANAVIATRFDFNSINGVMCEISAYDTAVTVEPLSAIDASSDDPT